MANLQLETIGDTRTLEQCFVHLSKLHLTKLKESFLAATQVSLNTYYRLLKEDRSKMDILYARAFAALLCTDEDTLKNGERIFFYYNISAGKIMPYFECRVQEEPQAEVKKLLA